MIQCYQRMWDMSLSLADGSMAPPKVFTQHLRIPPAACVDSLSNPFCCC